MRKPMVILAFLFVLALSALFLADAAEDRAGGGDGGDGGHQE